MAKYRPLDLSPLSRKRAAPPPFPQDMFGERWREWIAVAAQKSGAPFDYVAAALFGITSGLIANVYRVEVRDGWQEAPILWPALIGDPSAKKSPPLRRVMALIEPIQRLLTDGHKSVLDGWEAREAWAAAQEAEWKKAMEKAVKDGRAPPPKPAAAQRSPKPRSPAVWISDATIEAMALQQVARPEGVMLFFDELSGWLKDFEKYGVSGAREIALSSYNGDQQRIDRVKHDMPIQIPHYSMPVLGGIQPDKFGLLVKGGANDGLAARFCCFFPDPIPPATPPARTLATWPEVAMRRIADLPMAKDSTPPDERFFPNILRLCPAAAEQVTDHDLSNYNQQQTLDSELLKGVWGKRVGMAVRISCLLEVLEWAAADHPRPGGPLEVSEATIIRAIGFIENYEKPMAKRAFEDAAIPTDIQATTALARWIIQTRPTGFNARAVRNRGGCPGILGDPKNMAAACEGLVDAGWLANVGGRLDGKPGRQPVDFEVNPEALAMFSK